MESKKGEVARSRRALVGTMVMGGALLAGPAKATPPPDPCAGRLASLMGALCLMSPMIDYDDPAAEAAYYRRAAAILEAVIATPARTAAGLKAKAQAVLWCAGGVLKPGPDATTETRVVASLVQDVLHLES